MIIYALIYIKMQMHQSVHICAQILQKITNYYDTAWLIIVTFIYWL